MNSQNHTMNYITCLSKERVDVKGLDECLKMTDAPKEDLPLFNALDEHRRTVVSKDASVSHLIVDFDSDFPSSKILWKKMLKGFEYYMYDSSSSCAEASCFRLIIPLKEKVKAIFIKHKNKALQEIFFGCDIRSFDVGRWFFCPSVKCGQYRLNNEVVHEEGQPLDFYELVHWSKLDELNLKSKQKKRFETTFANMSDDERVRYYLDTEFPLMRGNGNSASSLYTAITVCLFHKDYDSFSEVLDKARRENWSEKELKRKIKDAKNFLNLDEEDESEEY